MMFNKKLLPLCMVVFMFLNFETHAQEPNFSLYHYSPTFTNPGRIGAEEDVRIMFNYRNQAIDLDKNFTTSSFSAYYPVYIGRHRLVAAASFLNNQSSDILTINGGMAGLAYSLQTTTTSALSLGIQAGYFQRNPGDNYTTDDQYVDGVFNPGAVSGDAALQVRKAYPAFSGGLYYKVKDGAGLEKAFIGASIFNINKPNVSLASNEGDDLPMIFKSTAGYRVYHNTLFSVIPNARWVGQVGTHFFNLGSRFGYELNKKGTHKIELGIWYNTNHLGVFSLAYEQPHFTIAASFDQPVGTDLSKAQNSIVELAISYRLKKKNKPSFDKNSQPIAEPVEKKEEEITEEVVVTEPQKPLQELPKNDEDVEIPSSIREQSEQETFPISPDTKRRESLTVAEEAVLARTVKFDFNSENLDNESKAFLDEVVTILINKENFNIELKGHSCNLGPENVNQELSLKRAGIVKEYLVKRGVDQDRFTVMGMGESDPLEDNSSQEGREHNRRVEFKVVYEK
ncbi:PorP/SprF family type IX secretion system membrane protein [Marivirga sp. S37H4]|uniref:PorP/SprF family type IX secretion system membrane protein n=1 Tax=Marivirga aurantiaca TaxID=2802615 RepID=A0A935C6H2_9BACT|nr:PorP/SprF family type IX secretion system membrane protein [Marivirga aurantiaca]MBK6264369.1 PorP/SprF family type IX secretion system membrane protein [Marivirga aurantiaca]